MKSLPNYNWNQWQAACKVAWETEGQQESFVHGYLLRCEKQVRWTLQQVAASAWRLYQYDKTGNAQ